MIFLTILILLARPPPEAVRFEVLRVAQKEQLYPRLHRRGKAWVWTE